MPPPNQNPKCKQTRRNVGKAAVIYRRKFIIMEAKINVEKLPHHQQMEFCLSRAKYRQGRKLTAVKVYTVNEESKYLILSGVPAIHITSELEVLCRKYGPIESLILLPDYPHEEFSEVRVQRSERNILIQQSSGSSARSCELLVFTACNTFE